MSIFSLLLYRKGNRGTKRLDKLPGTTQPEHESESRALNHRTRPTPPLPTPAGNAQGHTPFPHGRLAGLQTVGSTSPPPSRAMK